jgi:hypothetical protein
MTTLAITREYTSATYGLPSLIFMVRKEDSNFECKLLIMRFFFRERKNAYPHLYPL